MIENQDKNACPYNEGVVCFTIDRHGKTIHRCCEACGWNPEVAKSRLEKMRKPPKRRKTARK